MNNYKIEDNPYMSMEECGTLSEAFQRADAGASYSGYDIKICDFNGDTLYRRRWYGVEFDEGVADCSQSDAICFGEFGYFDCWRDVDGNKIDPDDFN